MGSILTLLIANRGEIAVRIARTCRELGIRVVAVHSAADADAEHVRVADEAVDIGPAPAAESYLRTEAILDAARRTGADAVHPGYGFLSENAAFARAVVDAGLVWVGPSPSSIELMGDKAASKLAMADAGVPVVPGVGDDTLDDDALAAAAREVGLPLLVKAVAGGGGKGMRPVHEAEDLPGAIAAARREAAAAFGDDRLIVEKLVQRPRHIEIQVFGDTHGDVVHLFERECSIQRRHQKIVEEAPAPDLSRELRDRIAAAAVAAARAVDYVGAGTVEFILGQDGEFAFLEMNTRLQVEHPVTELVTGHDLVAWQLLVAAGDPLPATQEELAVDGHAIEVRLYAEDPANGFLPDTGTLLQTNLASADAAPGVRIDTGVTTGSVVSRHYDPMLAKVIAHGADRDEARTRLAAVLDELVVLGVRTNLDHLRATMAEPAFVAGTLTTDFLDEHLPDWRPEPLTDDHAARIAAVIGAATTDDAGDVFAAVGPWRTAGGRGWQLVLRDRDVDHTRHVRSTGRGLVVDEEAVDVEHLDPGVGTWRTSRAGSSVDHVARQGPGAWWVHTRDGSGARTRRLEVVAPTRHADPSELVGGDAFTSPMPGAVASVEVSAGDTVTAGQTLIVVEAMKMEHPVVAPADGTVTDVFVRPGDAVTAGQDLLAFDPSTPETAP